MGMRNTWALWQPDETIEAIAEVLSSRWSAARSQPAGGLFWPSPTSWLRQQAQRLADNGREIRERYLHVLTREPQR